MIKCSIKCTEHLFARTELINFRRVRCQNRSMGAATAVIIDTSKTLGGPTLHVANTQAESLSGLLGVTASEVLALASPGLFPDCVAVASGEPTDSGVVAPGALPDELERHRHMPHSLTQRDGAPSQAKSQTCIGLKHLGLSSKSSHFGQACFVVPIPLLPSGVVSPVLVSVHTSDVSIAFELAGSGAALPTVTAANTISAAATKLIPAVSRSQMSSGIGNEFECFRDHSDLSNKIQRPHHL